MSKAKKGKIPKDVLELALASINGVVEEKWQGASDDELAQHAMVLASEYDFDAAAAHFKEALLRSSGRSDLVEAFARFLVDEAGWVDQALALLSAQGCSDGAVCKRLYARSLTLAGHDAAALLQWSLVNAMEPDADSVKAEFSLLIRTERLREAALLLDRSRQDDSLAVLLGDLERQLKEAAVPFWQHEVRQFSAELCDHSDPEWFENRLAAWKGIPGIPAQALVLKSEAEARVKRGRTIEWLDAANQSLSQGDLTRAADLARKVLELKAEHPEALAILGTCEKTLQAETLSALRTEAQRRFQSQDSSEVLLWLAGRGLPTAEWMQWVPALHEPLAKEVVALQEHFGQAPTPQQLQALLQLRSAQGAMAASDVETAELTAARVERQLTGLPGLLDLQAAIRGHKAAKKQQELSTLVAQASQAFLEGESELAADLLKRATALEGVTMTSDALLLQERVAESLKTVKEVEFVRRRLSGLLESQSFFEASLLLESASGAALDSVERSRARAQVKQGVSTLWPWSYSPYPAVSSGSEYRSESQGIKGLPTEQTLRLLVPYPGSDLLWLSSGDKAWLVSVKRMEMLGEISLPPQANLDDQRGVLLGDRGPDGQTLFMYIHLGNDAVMDFRYGPDGLRLNFAGKLSAMLPPAKGAHTRWFAPLGPEERFVVCQSAHDSQDASRLLSIPLTPGKSILDIEASYPLAHLRRLGQTPNLLMIHRQPNGAAMRLPGYFSFAFMDERLRLTERFHIPAAQLDNVFIESSRWTRISEDGKRIYALFSYFEGMTGQLIQRPLAFVAMERNGDLLYAVSDSSTLVQNHGDIEPSAEVVSWNGRDYLACVVRKREVQSLTLVDLATFKLVRRWECPDGEKLMAVVLGSEPGTVVCVSMVKASGTLRLRRHSVSEALR